MSLSTRGLFTRFAVLVAIVAALHALVWALMGATTLRVDPDRWISFLGICAIMAAAGFIALSILRMELLGSILLLLALGYAVGRAAIMLTYVVYDLGRDIPPWDAVAARADAALGFHWPDMLAWFNANPAISDLLAACHQAFLPQPPIVLIVMALAARVREAQVALLAGVVGLLITLALVLFMPVYGAYSFFGLTAAQHPNIELVSAALTMPERALARTGVGIDIDPRGLMDVITLPDFQALLAVVCGWAWWFVPYLRWPGMTINAGMLAATPLHGSHYLVDVIVGVALAVVSIVVASRLLARFETRRHAIRYRECDWVPAR
jgi:hypothetical protein